MRNLLEPIIQQIRKLSLEQRNSLFQHLETMKIQDEEKLSSIVNICLSDKSHKNCPHCKSSFFIKYGLYKDRHRYRCKTCDRTFNDFTGTAWHYIHDFDKFQYHFQCLAEQKTLEECTMLLDICMQTAFVWRHKILKAFEKIDLNLLKKHIQADETFILQSSKGNPRQIRELQRTSRKRGGRANSSGITDDHICILVACDEDKNTILQHTGNGRLTKDMVFNALGGLIRK